MQPTSKRSSTPPLLRPPWTPTTERIAIVAFWLFLAALELLRRKVNPFLPPQLGLAAYVGVASYLVWMLITPVIFGLAQRLPLERETGGRRLALLLGAGLLIAISVELLQFGAIQTLLDPSDFPERPGPPPSSFSPFDALLRLWFLDDFVIYLAVLAVGFARNYFIRLHEREQESARLQAEAASLQAQLADARLSALRMQLNPHFLFNTLNTISSLADDDPEGVQRIVARLSGLLRRTLEGANRQEVPLTEELAFLRDYLEIQQVRFQGHLEVLEDVDDALHDALVPYLILQPLVENAIKHGSDEATNPIRRIVLSVQRKANQLVLAVRDNGPGMAHGAEAAAADAGRVGLANTRARLEALYGTDASLFLGKAPEGGLAAIINVPYHTAADLRAVAAIAPSHA